MRISDFIIERKHKNDVAKLLGITPQWLHACYLKIAEQVTDFIFDYPQLGNTYRKRSGLTKYQIWVLENLVALVKGGMTTTEMVYQDSDGMTIFNEQLDNLLSKENYLKTETTEAEEQEVQNAELVIN
jgi:hypothetical protein